MLIEIISKRSNVEALKLKWIARTASRRYKSYPITKKDGSERIVEHPSRELKAIQRWINRVVLRHLPVHQCATAYKKGAKISTNASLHKDSNYTVRVDFTNFFPSFNDQKIDKFIRKINNNFDLKLTEEDILFSVSVLTKDNALVIGAPSSPMLTNAMMYDFDHQLYEYATMRGLIYTRYADDLFFSSRDKYQNSEIEDFVKKTAAQFPYANLKINEKKTAYLSRKYKRSITGLVITPDHKVSIGRHRKREIKALVHQYINNICDNKDQLMGLLAFASDAEPTFVDALSRKYGIQVIRQILNQ